MARSAVLVAALSLALCVSLGPAPASGGNDAAPDVEAVVKRARESRLGIDPQWLRLVNLERGVDVTVTRRREGRPARVAPRDRALAGGLTGIMG